MKRSLYFLTSAIAFGALTGFLVSDFARLSAQLPPALAALLPKASAAAAKPASAKTAFGRLINATVAALDHTPVVKPPPAIGLLLKEPVVVVQGPGKDLSTLPVGTAVSVVKNEGVFVSVRHAENVITIPRSAVVVGLVRAN